MLQVHPLTLGAFQTHCYIVFDDGSDSCVVIDPGYDPATVLDTVAQLGKTVAAVLLTHGHFDHVGGVRHIADATGCPVYLSEYELALPQELTDGPLYYTHTYSFGEDLSLAGLKLQALHTPGHTAGSVCLLTQGAMFSGDTLFAGTCGRTDLPTGSYKEILLSLQKLAALPKDYTVYPGHGHFSTLSVERAANPYMQPKS
jgi:glyoxylase-like metal-dependent hydrolase (beta-lactamase superfamily II)